MTETVPTAMARCSECGQTYRVRADASRTYHCKSCGGQVTRVDMGTPANDGDIAGTVECPECQAIQPRGLHFCAECGTSLDYDEGAPVSAGVVRLRQEAAEALKRAYRLSSGVTWLYRAGAAAYAVATLFAILALGRTDVPREGGVLVVGLTTLLSVLLLMGSLHLLFQPVLWTLAIALLATGVSVVHFIGPDPLDVAFLASVSWATLAWFALFPTRRFQQLVAHHKDLYILHHASTATRRSLRGRDARERHERLVSAMRRAASRTWKVSTSVAVGLIALSAAGSWVVLYQVRPADIGPALERFVQAWDAEDWEAIEGLYDPRLAAVRSGELVTLLDGIGWTDRAPELNEIGRELQESGYQLTYRAGSATLEADWAHSDQAWRLVRLHLPVPSLEPEVGRWVAAWEDSDLEGVLALFRPEKRDELRGKVEAAVQGRGWEHLPEILRYEIDQTSEREARVRVHLEPGELACQWFFGPGGHWRLIAMHFPER